MAGVILRNCTAPSLGGTGQQSVAVGTAGQSARGKRKGVGEPLAAGRWEGSGRVQSRMRSQTSRGHCRGTDGGRSWPRDRGVTIVTICATPTAAVSHGP